MAGPTAKRRDEVLAYLRAELPRLRTEFGVASLSLFGSTARDEAADGSDVDLLVTFDGPADFDRFFGLKLHLEDTLGVSVDLVTNRALRPEIRPTVERDLVDVA